MAGGHIPLLHAVERVKAFVQLPDVTFHFGHFLLERLVFGAKGEAGQTVKHQFVFQHQRGVRLNIAHRHTQTHTK